MLQVNELATMSHQPRPRVTNSPGIAKFPSPTFVTILLTLCHPLYFWLCYQYMTNVTAKNAQNNLGLGSRKNLSKRITKRTTKHRRSPKLEISNGEFSLTRFPSPRHFVKFPDISKNLPPSGPPRRWCVWAGGPTTRPACRERSAAADSVSVLQQSRQLSKPLQQHSNDDSLLVCAQLPTSADDVTLLAVAAQCTVPVTQLTAHTHTHTHTPV